MSYQVTAVPFGNTASGEQAALFSITNSTGSCLEVSNYGCTVKSVTLCGSGGWKRRAAAGLDALSDYEQSACPIGAALLWEGGQMLETSRSVWQVADVAENSVALFQTVPLPTGGTGSFVVRFTWMDHDRLIIDMSGSSETPFAPAGTVNLYTTLSEDGHGSYLLRDFSGAGKEPQEADGLPQPLELPCDRLIQYCGSGGQLHPMAELICPESDLTLTAYTTGETLRVRSVSSPFPALLLNMGAEDSFNVVQPGQFWNQRIIYGFDAVYHGPKRILPFGM